MALYKRWKLSKSWPRLDVNRDTLTSYSGSQNEFNLSCFIKATLSGRLLIFDGFDFTTRVIKLRPRQLDTCVMCKQANSTVDDSKRFLESFDYAQFCGVSTYNDKGTTLSILDVQKQRISCRDYNELRESHLLIDVRPECQFKICALPNSINIPIDGFDYEKEKTMEAIGKELGTNKSSIKSFIEILWIKIFQFSN